MKKITKSTKFVKAIIGLGTFAIFALPASFTPAFSVEYGNISPQDIQMMQMQGGMNYRHEEDALKKKYYQE